jgi:homoserine O-acetyltransferase
VHNRVFLKGMMAVLEAGDIADGGDLAAALRGIAARVLLMPSDTDLYFRVADNAAELPHLRDGRLVPIPSIWGHRAGNPVANPEDAAFLRREVRRFLAA